MVNSNYRIISSLLRFFIFGSIFNHIIVSKAFPLSVHKRLISSNFQSKFDTKRFYLMQSDAIREKKSSILTRLRSKVKEKKPASNVINKQDETITDPYSRKGLKESSIGSVTQPKLKKSMTEKDISRSVSNRDVKIGANDRVVGGFVDDQDVSEGANDQVLRKVASNPDARRVVNDLSSRTSETNSELKRVTEPNEISKFHDLKISRTLIDVITKEMKYEDMTPVQAQSIPMAVSGNDLLVKAKTGTGKTLSFLVPAIEKIIQDQSRSSVALILSPTRELASQIATEALVLSQACRLGVQCLVGGTNVNADKVKLSSKQTDLLIATPGRLLQHINETPITLKILKKVKVFVLDEADKLLDMGFSRDINAIIDHIPSPDRRQNMVFSATFSKEMKAIALRSLRSDYHIVDLVGDEDLQTHSHVPQTLYTVDMYDQIYFLANMLEKASKSKIPEKIIVYFATAKQTSLMASYMSKIGIDVMEIHSRLSQNKRTKTSNAFKDAKRAILFSSDVTARGMDYPDITTVIQVGVTTKEQYIHRLGRTARAGKNGQGILICFPTEVKAMIKTLNEIPIEIKPPSPSDTAEAFRSSNEQLYFRIRRVLAMISSQTEIGMELNAQATATWLSWVGFYKSQGSLKWSPNELVDHARSYAQSLGLSEMPKIPSNLIGKMGLKFNKGFEVGPPVVKQRRN